MSGKNPAAAAAVLQLQLNQLPFESIQNIKLLMCIMFSNNKSITFQIIQYANFFSFTFEKSAAAAAAIVQLQQQYQFKMSNYSYIPSLVIINEFISTIIQFEAAAATAAAAAMMRLQGCSCSSNILLNQFRMSNKPYVQNIVIVNRLFPKLFSYYLYRPHI